MKGGKYIIVGADLGDEQNTITFDESGVGVIVAMADSLSPEGTVMATLTADPALAKVVGSGPLNVEAIGRLMVHMSENPSPSEAQKANYESVVKYAMTVLERPKDGKLDDADRAALLAETQVRIEFETRAAVENAADKNVRILVVPSDGTLAEGQSAAKQMDPHYQPPLSYDLDEFLMLSHLRDKVEKLLRDFDGSQVAGWECTHLPALLGHAEAWINENTYHHIDGAPDADDAFNQILDTPERAFHRAVGIYGTNMCR